jgi:hypothetical protein
MQTHLLTLGRNIGKQVNAVDVERAIDYFVLCLKTLDCNSFSVYEGRGYWDGIPENTIRFEVFGITDSQALLLARWLATTFHQEAVMLLSVNSRPKFITSEVV